MPSGFDSEPFQNLNLQMPPRKVRAAVIGGAVVLLAIAGALTSVYTVQADGKAVIKRFGKVVSIRQPGLHFKLPFGIETAMFVPTERVLKQEFGFRTQQPGRQTRYSAPGSHTGESLMLTGDLNVVDVKWVVQFRIKDPNAFLHRVYDPIDTLRDISEAVMRRIVGNRLGSEVLTVARVEIAAQCREEMQGILDSYGMGVHINTVELQDVTPPDPVKPAFNEVNEARQEKERLINEAEKRRNQVIPRARGKAQQIVSEAEGYAAERVNMAQGEADRFKAILQQYKQAKDVTRQRLYLERLEQILKTAGKVYVVDETASMPLPLLQLREDGAASGQGKGANR